MKLNLGNFELNPTLVMIVAVYLLSSWGLNLLWGHGWFQGLGPVLCISMALSMCNDFFWKWPINKYLIKIPNLNGKYKGKVKYSYHKKDQEKEVSMAIKQNASHISIKCTFRKEGESDTKSDSKEAILSKDSAGDYSLIYYYQNEGSHNSGDSLEQHDGFGKLEVNLSDPIKVTLEGFYFTNRSPQTKGHIKVTLQRRK